MDIPSKSFCRKKGRVTICFSIISCILIYYIFEYYTIFSPSNSSIDINSKRLFNRSISSLYDYYFRIEYAIINSPCQPLNTFQTIETMEALEEMTKEKINEILSDSVTVDLQIMKINATLQHLNRYNQKLFLMERSEVVCNYTLELFSGMNFPSYCDSKCQLSELHRITLRMNSFDYSIDPLMTFIPSSENPIKYSIHNIFIHRTVKIYEENVYVKSANSDFYLTVSTCDSDTFQPTVSMSTKTRSLFILKKGLDLSDATSIYISFASWSGPNYYLRHAHGQLKMEFNDNSILFRQDSTFKVLLDQQRDSCVFQAINTADYHFLAFDNTTTNVFLARHDKPLNINELDRKYFFKLIPNH